MTNLNLTIAKIGPWLIALAPAWFVFEAMTGQLHTPWFIAAPVAIGVECTGVAAFHTALAALSWNRARRKTDPAAPAGLSLALVVVYLVAGIILTAVLKNDWTLSIFFILAGSGYAVIALQTDHAHRQQSVAQARAQARADRQQKYPQPSNPPTLQPSNLPTFQPSNPPPRNPHTDQQLAQLHQHSGGQPFRRLDVQTWLGRGKTTAADIIKYGLETHQVTDLGDYQYQVRNGHGLNGLNGKETPHDAQ